MPKNKRAAGAATATNTKRERRHNIKSPSERKKLRPRPKPYFYRVGPNSAWSLGYRKTAGSRVWVLRYRDPLTGNYRVRRLVNADDTTAATETDVDELARHECQADESAARILVRLLDRRDPRIAVLDFAQALKLAEHIYRSIGDGAPRGPNLTIGDAVYGRRDPISGRRKGDGYLADREAEGKNTHTAVTALEAHILPRWRDTLIADLTVADLKAWRDALATTAPRVRSSKFAGSDGPQFAAVDLTDAEVRRRRRSSVNRITTTFKAILNYAARMYPNECPNSGAWREGLKAFRDVDVPRDRWLNRDEVIRLLNGCRADFRKIVQGALYTGARYSELCRAKVRHYNHDIKALRIPTSKSGKWRDVILHDEAAAFFKETTRGRSADAWVFTREDPVLVHLRTELSALENWTDESTAGAIQITADDFDVHRGNVAQHLQLALQAPLSLRVTLGREDVLQRIDKSLQSPWSTSHQVRLMNEACRAAKIKPAISFHGLRHTYASIAAQSGMALIALARNLGHSSTRMVERHYGHLSDQYMRDQVASYAPTFGLTHGNSKVADLHPSPGTKTSGSKTRTEAKQTQ